MLTFSAEFGATIPTGDYSNVKVLIRIDGIDPDGDVEAQVDKCLAGGTTAWKRIDEAAEIIVTDIVSVQSGNPTLSKRVADVEATLGAVKSNLNKVVQHLKGQKAGAGGEA